MLTPCPLLPVCPGSPHRREPEELPQAAGRPLLPVEEEQAGLRECLGLGGEPLVAAGGGGLRAGAPSSASPGRAARRTYHGGLNYYLLCLNANQVQEPVCPELAKPALLNIWES